MTHTRWSVQDILGALLLPIVGTVIVVIWVAAESKTPVEGEVLLTAAERGDEATVLRSLASGTPVNCVERGSQMTPIMYAAARGRLGVARVLLANGADLRQSTLGCGAAIAHAARSGGADMIRLLLDYGADPNSSTPDGFTPLMHAVHASDMAAVEALMRGGADIHSSDRYGQTAMSLATSLENPVFLARFQTLVAQRERAPTSPTGKRLRHAGERNGRLRQMMFVSLDGS